MFKLFNQDSISLPFPDNSIDAIVTDPPYGLGKNPDMIAVLRAWLDFDEYEHSGAGFMGKKWDVFVPDPRYWKECYRVLKPGGPLLSFAGSRTQGAMEISMRIAGFEIRDCLMWLYGTGFPKSHNISKAIDKAAGAKRSGGIRKWQGGQRSGGIMGNDHGTQTRVIYDTPVTPDAQLWDGYGTALKPAYEPIILAMKSLDGTYAQNAIKHGVAGLWIDGGRIIVDGEEIPSFKTEGGKRKLAMADERHAKNHAVYRSGVRPPCLGRWPANIILDEIAGQMLDEQSGERGGGYATRGASKHIYGGGKGFTSATGKVIGFGDSGGASRFFYCAKASKTEREAGLTEFDQHIVNDGRATSIDNAYQRGDTLRRNTHPTVKPLALMRYLCRLIRTPYNDCIILDPFVGSGTTGMAALLERCYFFGVEASIESYNIAQARVSYVADNLDAILKHESLVAYEKAQRQEQERVQKERQKRKEQAEAETEQKPEQLKFF